MALWEPEKYCIAKSVNRGIVKGVIRLTIAVRLIESATSPFAKLLNIFEVVPLGANDMIIKPTDSSGDNLNAIAISKAINGKAMI